MSTQKLIVVVVLAALCALPATLKAEDPVNFVDPALKAAVEAALGKTDPTPTDMLGLTMLDARNKGIVDLTGLEYASNLWYLNLERNQLSDLGPLSQLTNLTLLELRNCQIDNISALSELTKLTALELTENRITDIGPLSGLTSLRTLYLNSNQITDVTAIQHLTKLTFLNMNWNQVSDISPLAGLTNLMTLQLGWNQISDLSPLSGLNSLTFLELHSNEISDISPLSGLTNLTLLALAWNQVSDIRPVSYLTSLTRLELQCNQVDDISVLLGLTNITTLYLFGNQITDISSLAALTNLALLELSSNQVSDIRALSELRSLESVWLVNNPLNRDAYCVYIPIIRHNNPGISLWHDPNPPYQCAISVKIDIKPGSYSNAVNLRSKGVLPVAILSDTDFDAATVDPSTVMLSGAGVAVRGKGGKYMAHQEDVNKDSLLDLVVQVETENLNPQELQDGFAFLTGQTFDGQLIEGNDEITLVPR